MSVSNEPGHLPGYPNVGIITIRYDIPSGIQGENDPNPGKKYEGTSRIGYLPETYEGVKVLNLLRRAFTNRIIFNLGTSLTTGRDGVIWNIHHKTSKSGGAGSHGYPDPTYLKRVQEELEQYGVF